MREPDKDNLETMNIVKMLLRKCLPERKDELTSFWAAYPANVVEVAGGKGLTINANRHRIEFARKDLQLVWLMTYSAWKAIGSYAPAQVMGGALNQSLDAGLKLDEALGQIESEYKTRLAMLERQWALPEIDERIWPDDIPKPVTTRAELNCVEDQVTFDLTMMTTGVLFLHEMRHVKFDSDDKGGNARPLSRAEEELACDVFARDMFLSKAALFAKSAGHPVVSVVSKRAMALLLASYLLTLDAGEFGKGETQDYPALIARIQALSMNLQLPSNDHYWMLANSILIGELRRRHIPLPTGAAIAPDELYRALISALI